MENNGSSNIIEEKRWDIKKENEIIERWKKENIGKFRKEDLGRKPTLVIDTPPPYPSGKWHVAGAAHYVHHDMIARFFRMIGYNVLLPFYADRNGLPVEVSVEKKTGINPHEVSSTPEGREKFLALCKKELDSVEEEMVKLLERLGCSYDYWKNGTDSEEYRKLTQATFRELWKKGLIYVAERPVNWCPRCKTTLSDAELEYKELETYLYYIKFKIRETNDYVTVATTRPELLSSCKALIYHPSDPRYSGLEGKTAISPIYEKELKIYKNENADPNFGTGLVMICSYGDEDDIKMFRELGLEPEIVVDRDGRLNEKAGFLKGMKTHEARTKIAEELEKRGLMVKKEKLMHKVPVCWRCGTPIEFIHVREYFLKQIEFKDKLLEAIDKMKFYPEMHKQKLIDWINSIKTDWPISRDRYYATEIPTWRCKKCNSILVPEDFKYYRPWKDEPPFEKCPVCGADKSYLEGEKKVFDTWFDSSISSLYITGYMKDNELYEKLKNDILRPQGYEIIRTWLYYSILRVYQLTGRPAFKYVRITGMGLDEKGEAMHKSKGNVIDPFPVIESYGADAFRFWAASAAKVGYDYRFNPNLLKTGLLFTTKLWNISRFISRFPDPGKEKAGKNTIDKAILEYTKMTLRKYISSFKEMDTYEPSNLVYSFTWDIFASNYIELVKQRAYNLNNEWSKEDQESAWATLHLVLRTILLMTAPIMPFISDEIWRLMKNRGSIHQASLTQEINAEEGINDKLTQIIDLMVKVNSDIWKYKKQNGLKFSDEIAKVVYIPQELKEAEKDLKALHKLKYISYEYPPPGEGAIKLDNIVYIEK